METMLARFERMLEQAVEGGLRRVFPSQLQPVQLAKAAARAMEDEQVVGLRGPEVPNLYLLQVAPEDMARFAEYRATLSQELARYLADYAADRGLQPVGPPRVELEEDARVRPGLARVQARFVDLTPERQAALEEALEGTRHLRLSASPPALARPAESHARAWLEEPSGRRHPLDPHAAPVRLGRSLENDVVLASPRVSRYHAHLRFERGRWLVYDLQSTNGTIVGEQRAEHAPLPLADGDVLGLGDVLLTFRVPR